MMSSSLPEDGLPQVLNSLAGMAQGAKWQAKVKKKKQKKRYKLPQQLSSFEHRYSEIGSKLIPEKKHIDYVLMHRNKTSPHKSAAKKNRDKFENLLKEEGFSIYVEVIGNDVFTQLFCPFKRLCLEAERVKLEMPLDKCEITNDEPQTCFQRFLDRYMKTDNEVDFISAQFIMDRIHLFLGYENPTNFFRPALRSLLTHLILINMDIRDKNSDDDSVARQGLPYLLKEGVYSKALILHDHSLREEIEMPLEKNEIDQDKKEKDELSSSHSTAELLMVDARNDMDNTWRKFWKFQPLWKIRNYFGEKIAFYFAWSGLLITFLWMPTLFGLIIFMYGLYLSSLKRTQATMEGLKPNGSTQLSEEITERMTELLSIIKESFDNEVTPYFALLICIWGTVFLEFWKRKSSILAYEWDVDSYEAAEPDRPQFFGISHIMNPVTQERSWFYPQKLRLMKYIATWSVILFMISLVLISMMGVIVYRVVASIDICPNISSEHCFFFTTLVSSLLNAISIIILGKLYSKLAYKLTDWENHRTQTNYDDALILKLFAFHFVNSYSSCIYIAFFRGWVDNTGILGLGLKYKDNCEGSCMSQLSFQVFVLMLTKPFPKFFSDILIPWLKKMWKKGLAGCKCEHGKVEHGEKDKDFVEFGKLSYQQKFLKLEQKKPALGDFTLSEYTEKVIQYGYLMLFTASFPLAPLMALLTNLIDIRVDAKRLLWWYQRPLAFTTQDIGVWYPILQFINICGVVTNSFLIAYTSSWARNYTTVQKLWIVIGFEHLVFAVKLFFSYAIPDMPSAVRVSIQKEKYKVMKKIEEARDKITDYKNIVPASHSWHDNGQWRNFKEPILEEPPEKRDSILFADETDATYVIDVDPPSSQGVANIPGVKPQKAKRRSMFESEYSTKQKKRGSTADDENGDSDELPTCRETPKLLPKSDWHNSLHDAKLSTDRGASSNC